MYGVTWERYRALYGGEEEAFLALLPVAARKLDAMTARRIAGMDPDDWRYAPVGDALCALLNAMLAQRKTGRGEGVTSVSNDGYSESYRAVTPEDAEAELRAAARACLSGTGLMSAL